MNKLREKQKIIQEQAKLIKEKEKESSAEGRNAQDKEKERDHAEMTQRLEESEALSTKSMNELSELINEKERDSKKLLAAAVKLHETLSTRAMN